MFKVLQKIYFVGCLSIFYFIDFEQVLLQALFHKLKPNIRASVQTSNFQIGGLNVICFTD